eukprot:1176155-Prorocentrum_minimum.AAC.3
MAACFRGFGVYEYRPYGHVVEISVAWGVSTSLADRVVLKWVSPILRLGAYPLVWRTVWY